MSQSKRVLVADDNRVNLMLLQQMLRSAGYDVVTAEDGEEALEAIQRTHPDVVLLDIMMPKLDGLEVLQHLRADPELAATPVILLSAVDDFETVARALELSAWDFLSKPYRLAQVTAAVESALAAEEEAAPREAGEGTPHGPVPGFRAARQALEAARRRSQEDKKDFSCITLAVQRNAGPLGESRFDWVQKQTRRVDEALAGHGHAYGLGAGGSVCVLPGHDAEEAAALVGKIRESLGKDASAYDYGLAVYNPDVSEGMIARAIKDASPLA
ncbi:MAG: response regulator [Deltaproteobacteria bacterium]|nr:MAG: response regulator [Deltaproteobacteria bacterium]